MQQYSFYHELCKSVADVVAVVAFNYNDVDVLMHCDNNFNFMVGKLMRMTLYKNIANRFKKTQIMSTTLLSIKWGKAVNN